MKSTLLAVREHPGPVIDSARGFDLIACETCGFTHVMPLPTPETLDDLYREDYYVREKPDYLEKVGLDQAWYTIGYRERFDTFERFLPSHRRRMADVGCGPGFLAAHGVQRGWEAIGVEPSRQAAAHARGLGVKVIEDFFSEDVVREMGPIDVVQMTNVLEHVADPMHMLALAHSALRPGGLICIVVPNDYNPIQDALRRASGYAPWWVAPPHHLNYFTFGSLEGVLRKTGYAIAERTTTFPMELFLLLGYNYVVDSGLGRVCHERRMTLETTLGAAGHETLRRDLYRAFAQLSVGREAVVVARKP
jgi:SAM-dependent methyltransferase